MATGDFRIDALLEIGQASLASRHTPGLGAEVTYSFLSSPSVSYQVYGFQSFSQEQRNAIRSMLDEVSSQIGVTFREVDQGGSLGYGLYTGRTGIPSSIISKAEFKTDANGSVVWLNSTFAQFQNLNNGEGRQIALHETGHALGLKHPGQYSEFDTGPYLPAELSTANHTIMAYSGGNTEHLGDLDVLALQYLYGPTSVKRFNFDDRFTLDTKQVASSVSISGGAGIDRVDINMPSANATLRHDLKQFTYAKADGSFSSVYLNSVERIHFTDRAIALDIDGNAGQAYRLYKAAFDRTPDKEGLGFWIGQLDRGASIDSVAAGFVASQEFQTINGASPSNLQLVTSLYQHILGRAPDQSGLGFWTAQMDSNKLDKSHLLTSFAESNENKIALTGQVQNGIEYVA